MDLKTPARSDPAATRDVARQHSPALRQSRADSAAELEFKLAVPATRSAAIQAELNRGKPPERALLAAHYVDTPDDRLTASGLSLRLRQENGRWFQTLKMKCHQGNLQRAEHEVEVDVPDDQSVPQIDLRRHRGTAAGQAACDALTATGGEKVELVERFSTRVVRMSRRVSWRGSIIELAFDQGEISAGEHRLPLNELELELKHGNALDLATLTRRWLKRHGLWLLAEAKADRGRRLLHRQPFPPPVKADAMKLGADASPDAMARAVVANCLSHVLPNAAAVAEGSVDADHVHQLRVGLRRVRTALRELAGFSSDMPLQSERPLARVFRELGTFRDRSQIVEAIAPQLMAAGAHGTAWAGSAAEPVDVAALARRPAFQLALLQLAGFAFSDCTADRAADPGQVRKRLRRRLRRLHKEVVTHGRRFKRLDEDRQHEVRKQLKRLRYLSEFASPWFDPVSLERYLDSLKPAQEVLGNHNDLAVAAAVARPRAKKDPDARFALRWLERAQRGTARKTRRTLKKVDRAPRFRATHQATHAAATATTPG